MFDKFSVRMNILFTKRLIPFMNLEYIYHDMIHIFTLLCVLSSTCGGDDIFSW